jgi:hypothetical protein
MPHRTRDGSEDFIASVFHAPYIVEHMPTCLPEEEAFTLALQASVPSPLPLVSS